MTRIVLMMILIVGAGWGMPAALAQAPAAATAATELPRAVADMKSLIEQGRFAEAFDLGLKNDALVGDPIYDYYFGIAAVDSGRASLGVLALERVLLSNPGNDLARLELARGYFVLQDYERAREEFTFMTTRQLPPPVRASVDKYLASIREQDPQFRTVFKGYVDYGLGRNTNVSTIADGPVPFPLFGKTNPPIFVSSGSTESSPLGQLAVGAQVSGPIRAGLKYLASLDASHRHYSGVDNFDQASGTVAAGLETAGEADRYRAIAYFNEAQLDGDRLRSTSGASVDWQRSVSRQFAIRSSLSHSQLRYAPTARDRDSGLTSFGVGLTYNVGGPAKWVIDSELSAARESNDRNNDFFSRNVVGLRVSLGVQPMARLQMALTVSYSNSDYDEPDPIGVRIDDKVDDLWGLELAMQYQLTPGWSVRGELAYARNDSNEPLFEYDQRIALLKMRYEWK